MSFDFKEITTAFMSLFPIINIIGCIPAIVSVKNKAGRIEPERISLLGLAIMLLILFLGEKMLSLIGISVSSFAVAGSFVVFFISLEMILGIQIYKHDNSKGSSLVPLAFPLIVGPGTLTTILSLKTKFSGEAICVAIVLNVIFIYIVLKFLGVFERLLGQTGIAVAQRIFGIILLAIAVMLFTGNIKQLL